MTHDAPDYSATIQQMFDLWVTPEVHKRQADGLCPKPLDLWMAQVIFYPDGRGHLVRINDEVKVSPKVKLKPGITKEKGAAVYLDEIEEMHLLELPDSEDPECGHITVYRVGKQWFLGFDFRYHKGWAERLIEAAKEFVEASDSAAQKQHWRAFIDNLFSSAELASKAFLLSMVTKPEDIPNSHKAIQVRLNRFAKTGTIKAQHRDIFNKLARDRRNARYPRHNFVFSKEEADVYLNEVKGLIKHSEEWMRRVPTYPSR